MRSEEVKQKVFAALSLLKSGRRDEAAEQLALAITRGPAGAEQWKSIDRLAGQIGEVDLAIEAMRRFPSTEPAKLSRKLEYWKELTGFGRSEIVETEIAELQDQVGDHPAVLHVQGQTAAQKGDFDLGDRILAVDYEQLVRHPGPSIQAIASDAGLKNEVGMERFHEPKRPVRTASLQQVRRPISTGSIGHAQPYAAWMGDFWRSYEEAGKRFAARSTSAVL